MRYILSCVVLVSLSISSLYSASWAKTFGGTNNDHARSICKTSDGGYIVAGYTTSFGAGGWDFLVIKLNSYGNLQWAKTFGGPDSDYVFSICETSDGGYILAGWTESFGAGWDDFLVIKLNSSGNIQWAKTFGGTGKDWILSICETSDGGYIVAGYTTSFGASWDDFLVIKLNSSGNIQWAKTFGGTNSDWAYSICETSDGGYIVAGSTSSFGAGNFDFLVIKLNSYGNIEWAKTFGGTNYDFAYSICKTSDSGYIVAGSTGSFEAGNFDFLVIKLNSYGNIEWAKTFSGTDWDEAFSICETSDGGYIVTGWITSFGAGDYDFLVIKLNSCGNIEWAKTFDGPDSDGASSICQISDGGYIVAGYTWSFGAGNRDFLILKTEPDGSMTSGCPWYSANPTFTSPTLSTTSPNLTVTSPSISSSNVSLTITSPNLLIDTICSSVEVEEFTTMSPSIYFEVIPSLSKNRFYVKYELPKGENGLNKEFFITLSLYNLSGRLERVLFSGKKSSGVYKMNLDLNDLPSGIYFLRLSFDSNYFDRKLIIQR